MIRFAVTSLLLLAPPTPIDAIPTDSPKGVYTLWVSAKDGVCSYALMDVVGIDGSHLTQTLSRQRSDSPDVGLEIWVPDGTPDPCLVQARKAASSAGFPSISVKRPAAP
jgi:hypothetical protein